MPQIKNLTDEPLSLPWLNDLIVGPGESVEVEDASRFEDSPLWAVTGGGKRKPTKRTSKTTSPAETDGDSA